MGESAVESHYELFDHTADIGVRVFGPTLAALVAPAGEGLYAVIGKLAPGGSGATVQLCFAGDEPALLLRDYLAELLRLFEMRRQIVSAVEVEEFSQSRLAVTARAHPVDEKHSAYEREVKAVTYHELDIRAIPGGYQATYIVDI